MAYFSEIDGDDGLLQGTERGDFLISLGGDDTILSYGPPRDGRPDAEYRAQAADRADFVFAGGGDDRVHAGGGDDTVWGADGDDIIVGGAGADKLAGGPGDDTFVFGWLGGPSLAPDTRTGRNARDVIRDFEQGEDLIDLSGFESASSPGAVWLGTRAPAATQQLQVGYRIEGIVTVVEIYAPTGPGRGKAPPKPIGEIEVLGWHTLAESDFLL